MTNSYLYLWQIIKRKSKSYVARYQIRAPGLLMLSFYFNFHLTYSFYALFLFLCLKSFQTNYDYICYLMFNI